MDILRVACAAGFSGDRTDAAAVVVDALVAAGGPSFLIFETLAERTLALAQLARRNEPEGGYEPLLVDMLRPVLPRCLRHGIRVVSNFGAANPRGAALRIRALAEELGLPPPVIAVIDGDDVSGPRHRVALAEALALSLDDTTIVSANAYIGADTVAEALLAGAQIVVGGRLADPSLTVGPALAHFRWRDDDWDRLGRATMVGHLLECGAQVSGGYYADPGVKDVPGMARLGYPVAEIAQDGTAIIAKPEGSGGRIDTHTVREQLLYEIHDPSAYFTPDVVADISEAEVDGVGLDRVRLTGVRGHPRPDLLKVNVCFESGWEAEGEISYAGPRAAARARLAAETIRERMAGVGRLRIDLIGCCSVFGDDDGRLLGLTDESSAADVRMRVAMRHRDRRVARRLEQEVAALYCCGPAGGGGVRTALRPTLGTRSCFLPRALVPTRFEMLD